MISIGGYGQELFKQVLGVPSAQLVAIADVYSGRRDEAKKMTAGIRHFPEKANRRDGAALIVETPNQNHMTKRIDCVRARKNSEFVSRNQPRSAPAAHMTNRQMQSVTPEMAMSAEPQF